MHEAMYWCPREGDGISCTLCPKGCLIPSGEAGFCRVRKNTDGKLVALNYGRCTSLALDPIEKKPLYHFYPGSLILSVGTFGCNFHCGFCQNWQIAHAAENGEMVTPSQIVRIALDAVERGNIGVAYTYSEPLVWYEFVLDTAREVKKAGLKNVLVTNGFIRPEPFSELLPFIDALNIDVKGFTNRFYQETVHGSLEPVLAAAEQAVRAGKHVEITTLLIPGLNDREAELESLTDWVAGKLGPEVPLHFSRYFPNYHLKLAPTPLATMEKARKIAKGKLKYVYLGNV